MKILISVSIPVLVMKLVTRIGSASVAPVRYLIALLLSSVLSSVNSGLGEVGGSLVGESEEGLLSGEKRRMRIPIPSVAPSAIRAKRLPAIRLISDCICMFLKPREFDNLTCECAKESD